MGNGIQQELSVGWSREIDHDLTTEFDGQEWTIEFPVMIDCTYKKGRYDDREVACHGYAADAPFIDTQRQACRHYSKRFGIEAIYGLSESSLISTTVTDQTRRLLFVVISLLLQNVWRYLQLSQFGNHFQQIVHLTTDSSGNHPSGRVFEQWHAVASAAKRRRLRQLRDIAGQK